MSKSKGSPPKGAKKMPSHVNKTPTPAKPMMTKNNPLHFGKMSSGPKPGKLTSGKPEC